MPSRNWEPGPFNYTEPTLSLDLPPGYIVYSSPIYRCWSQYYLAFTFPSAAQYCSMLQEEAAVDLLRALTSHPDTHVDVRGLAECILGILDHHQSQRDILTDQPGQS